MEAFEIGQLLEQQGQAGKAYLEFLRRPSMSIGVYHLPADGVDLQSPHTEDEVYCVVSGRAQIRVGEEDRSVESGSIVLVAAKVPHRFHAIEEDLTVLVFFAPAEYSNQQRAS
jgi:mannose-6-phosphate isomerase-like protein (cupin superfamily)